MAALLLARLALMVAIPLTDPSEARYAEIARIMAQSGDWVTPWIAPDQPFWGKPPASFWAQALGISVFGQNEFAVRVPAIIVFGLTLWVLFQWARSLWGEVIARWSVLIYGSSLLPFTLGAAVMTDPYLVLATTWIMAAVWMSQTSTRWYWRYGLFLGVALGMLAKGPLVLVLAGGSLLPWACFSRAGRQFWSAQPWVRGSLLVLALCLPWYLLAEQRTPGFLHYFLIGEHILRFIEPGWSGDLYGGAHDHPKGTIWLYYAVGSMPWGLLLIYRLMSGAGRHIKSRLLDSSSANSVAWYLGGWALFTPVFFTLSGNVLWTYVLPALPAFSILVASSVFGSKSAKDQRGDASPLQLLALAVPVVMSVLLVVVSFNPRLLKNDKAIAQYADWPAHHAAIVFLGEPTSSVKFYSAGDVESVAIADFLASYAGMDDKPSLVAIRQRELPLVAAVLQKDYLPVVKTKEVSLFRLQNEVEVALGGSGINLTTGGKSAGEG